MEKNELFQTIFNDGYIGVIKQGGPAASAGSCMYRNPDGRKCAIGHCIKDDFYIADFEGSSIGSNSLTIGAVLDSYGFVYNSDEYFEIHKFLEDFQSCHDESIPFDEDDYDNRFMKKFKGKVKELAKQYSLTIPENVV